jgi:hypothetical protein
MNPSTGTFISMDTYQGSEFDPVSLHKYLYAGANPIMYMDPSGHQFVATMFPPISISIDFVRISAYLTLFAKLALRIVATALAATVLKDIVNTVDLGAIAGTSLKLLKVSLQVTSLAPAIVMFASALSTTAAEAVRAQADARARDKNKTGEDPPWRNNSVYVLYDAKTDVRYVGRTGRNPADRYIEHTRDCKKQPWLRGFAVFATGLTYNESKVLEQVLISAYTIQHLENARREIAAGRVDEFAEYLEKVCSLIEGYLESDFLDLMR